MFHPKNGRNEIDDMNRRALRERPLTPEAIHNSTAAGREIMADAAAARARDSASVNRRAMKEQAKRACAPVIAAMRAEMVKPEFRHLVGQTEA